MIWAYINIPMSNKKGSERLNNLPKDTQEKSSRNKMQTQVWENPHYVLKEGSDDDDDADSNYGNREHLYIPLSHKHYWRVNSFNLQKIHWALL